MAGITFVKRSSVNTFLPTLEADFQDEDGAFGYISGATPEIIEDCDDDAIWTSDSSVTGSIVIEEDVLKVAQGLASIKIKLYRYPEREGHSGGIVSVVLGYSVMDEVVSQAVTLSAAADVSAVAFEIWKSGTPIDVTVSLLAERLVDTSTVRCLTVAGGGGTWTPGQYVYVGANWAARTKVGKILGVSGSVISYYLYDAAYQNDFVDTDSIKENDGAGADGDASGTVSGAPSIAETTLDDADVPTTLGSEPFNYTYIPLGDDFPIASGVTLYITLECYSTSIVNHYNIKREAGAGDLMSGTTVAFQPYGWGESNFKLCVTGDALNKHVYSALASPVDISARDNLIHSIYSNRTGAFLKTMIDEAAPGAEGASYNDNAITISAANLWESKIWDISGIADAELNAVAYVGLKITNMDQDCFLWVDNFFVESEGGESGFYGIIDGVLTRIATGGAAGTPTDTVEFYEDFLAYSAGGIYPWISDNQAPTVIAGANGIIQLEGSGSTSHLRPIAEETMLPWYKTQNVMCEVREAQESAMALDATRMFGLFGNLASPPTNGIYWRHTRNGNYIAVCRSGGAETTIDSGVAAANNTFHVLRFEVTGDGSTVEFFVDGTSKGSITTNIPAVGLAIVISSGTTYGLQIDYVWVKQDR